MPEPPIIDPNSFEREETTDLNDSTPDRPHGMPLHRRILIGMGVGVVAGGAINAWLGGEDPRIEWILKNITEPFGQLFLRILLMIVIPLVFSSLIVGVAGMGDLRKIGRIGIKCLIYTILISAISVLIGITAVNTIRPGMRVDSATAQALEQKYGSDATRRVEEAKKTTATDSPLMTVVKTIVPTNPVAAVASDPPNMLHLMSFAVFLGIAMTLLTPDLTAPLLNALNSLFLVSAKMIDIVMKLAPYAVACLLFNNTARFGFDLLRALGWYIFRDFVRVCNSN